MLCLSASAAEPDPFAGVSESTAAAAPTPRLAFGENFGFRRELISEFAASEHAPVYSRQSIGFEALKKFSSETATKASVDFQGRLVRRDRPVPVQNDMDGARREGWWFEYHNAYLDLYNVLDPILTDEQQNRQVGRFNFRVGRFYVPFGLNLQTDTHGTLLQLSNERNFGFERDWYAGLWGGANEHVNYDAYYMAGSGYYPKWEGQKGLGALRLSLANRYSSEYGLEGGISGITGERLTEGHMPLATRRAGIDGRWRHPVPTGLFTGTSELSGGEDDADVRTQLYQAEYLHASRRWGLATQYRRFWKAGQGTDASVIGEATWYFRNDVGNSSLHWIKVNVERKAETVAAPRDLIVALQYYRYW
jgi:hypothetical protein